MIGPAIIPISPNLLRHKIGHKRKCAQIWRLVFWAVTSPEICRSSILRRSFSYCWTIFSKPEYALSSVHKPGIAGDSMRSLTCRTRIAQIVVYYYILRTVVEHEHFPVPYKNIVYHDFPFAIPDGKRLFVNNGIIDNRVLAAIGRPTSPTNDRRPSERQKRSAGG